MLNTVLIYIKNMCFKFPFIFFIVIILQYTVLFFVYLNSQISIFRDFNSQSSEERASEMSEIYMGIPLRSLALPMREVYEAYINYLDHFKKPMPEPSIFRERLTYFRMTQMMIDWQNRGSNATFGYTKFADWSAKEKAALLLSYEGGCEEMHQENCRNLRNIRRFSTRDGKIKDKVDWRKKNAVGPVLDQKTCPVCWAFSIVGVIESMAALRYNQFRRLSIQEVIDCSSYPAERTGCRAGRPLVYAMKYLCDKQIPLTTDERYPLTLADEVCNKDAMNTGNVVITSFKNSCHLEKNETKILELLNRGPVTALVNARRLFNYDQGIIHVNCETEQHELNHAVQLVGYDTTGDIHYYMLKNSWGRDWGEEGYARLAVGGNQCGVAFSIGSIEV